MPYAVSNGIRIYYEREGSGPPLVLHAGFGATLDLWRDYGYRAALANEYEVFLLDPRGQGRSDTPHDPAEYTYDQRVADVLAVLDAADVERAIFWGYSMGGRVAFAAARYWPSRFRAFIAGGMHPEAPSVTAEAPDFTEALAHLDAPMLVYVGERDMPFHDRARRATSGLARVTFVSLPGFNHGEALRRSDVVLPHVRRFLADSAP